MTVCLGYAGVGLQDGPWSSERKSAAWALGLVMVVKRSAVVVADGDGSRNVEGKDARVGSGVRYVRERSTAASMGFSRGLKWLVVPLVQMRSTIAWLQQRADRYVV